MRHALLGGLALLPRHRADRPIQLASWSGQVMSSVLEASDWYDVAIVGAGPAGLSLAAELSKNHLVVLLEKGKIRQTQKAWCILELDGFRAENELVLNRMTKGTIRLHDGSAFYDFSHTMKEGEACVLLDENRTMGRWTDIAKANGCTFHENTAFLDFKYIAGGIRLRTTAKEIRTRLVVDASGYSSPIMEKLRLDTRTDFLVPTYGGYVRNTSFEDPNTPLGLVMDSSSNVYAEYFPISEDKACAWIFRILSVEEFAEKSEKEWIDELRSCYASVLSKNPEVSGSQLTLERYGVIPMKKGQQKAADRVLLVGDAGGSTPYSMLGFNRIYKNYKSVAQQISKRIEGKDLTAESLNRISFNEGNDFSEVMGPMMIQTLTKLDFDDVLDITRRIQERDLFGEFVDLQAHAADNSLKLEHVRAFGRKLMTRPFHERFDMVRTSLRFLSLPDIVKLGHAVAREYLQKR